MTYKGINKGIYTDLDDYYDIISYFRLDLPVNENNFKYILDKFTNKKNNNLIKKLLSILNQTDFIEYKNNLLLYFSFYKDISLFKNIFTKIKMYKYRFSSLIYKNNPEIFSLLLDYFTINQLYFYYNIDKEYDNNYLLLINKIFDKQHADILIKIIERNFDTIINLNFNILYLISKLDNFGNILSKILQIYKINSKHNFDIIKDPPLILINCLIKYQLFEFEEHINNIIFFHTYFDKKKLHLNIIKKNYNNLFLKYIKIISKTN